MRKDIIGILIAMAMVLSVITPLVVAIPQSVEHQPGIPLTTDPKYDRNPSFVDDGTTFWLFYTQADNGGIRPGFDPDNDAYTVWYLQSTDKGTTWEDPAQIPGTRPTGFNQRDLAAFEDPATENIYVFVASGQSGASHDIYYYVFSGGWTGPNGPIVNGAGNIVGGHIDALVDNTGRFWLFYQSTADNSCDAVYSDDQGATWSDKIDVGAGPVNNIGGVPKAIQAADGRFHVVFTDGGDGIYHTSSTTGLAGSWSAPNKIAEASTFHLDAYDYDPMIYQTSDGTLLLFWAPWNQADDSQWIEYTYSMDGGLTWNDASPVITIGGYPGSLYGDADVFWWDMWPEIYEDPVSNNILLFYTSEANHEDHSRTMIDGNIWMKNLGILPELTEGETEWDGSNPRGFNSTMDLSTYAEISDNGNSNKPVVKCKWELVEAVESQLLDEDLDAKGLQIDPNLMGSRTIHFFAVVTAPNGRDTVDEVYADVFHPDGSFKYQILLDEKITDRQTCLDTFNYAHDHSPTIIKYNIGHYLYGEEVWTMIDYDEIIHELQQELAYIWHGTAEISYCQPAGEYRVDIIGVSSSNDWSDPLNNYFWYVPTTAIDIDFDTILYGPIQKDTWKTASGDTTFGTTTFPTVRNIGNVPVELFVQQTHMGFGYGWVNFRANLDIPSANGVVEYLPDEEARIPGVLPLCDEDKLDFGIRALKGQPGDEFNGELDLIARQHGQPPYDTPQQYIDQ